MPALPRALAALALGAALTAAPAPPAPRLALLAIDVNNFTLLPDDPPERLAALGGALGRRLAECGYALLPVDAAAEARARAGPGYFYTHPDAAAQLARAAGADWALVPRLNRASPYVSDLQLHVVRVSDAMVVSNRVVELKGFGMTPEVTAHLTRRGAAWMADQVSQAVEWAVAGSRGVAARRCRA